MSQRRSDAVIELGQRLVAQLDATDDLLVSWMAHYIAGLIDAAEKAPPESKATAQKSCANAVLELWRHRSSLPAGVRPLVEVDLILETLASLDDDRTEYRYYPAVLRAARAVDAEDKTNEWLALALDVDFVARRLIRTALQVAAERGASKAEPWVDLLAEAGATRSLEASIVELAQETEAKGVLDAARRRELNATLQRLESFAKFAAALAAEVRSELGATETGESEDGEPEVGKPYEDDVEEDHDDPPEADDADDTDEPG